MNQNCRLCGHTPGEHSQPGFEPQCTHAGCTCLHYRRPATPPPPATEPPPEAKKAAATPAVLTPATEPPQTIGQLLNAVAATDSTRLKNAAAKIQKLVDQLYVELDAHLEAADARKEVEELEAKLAAAKKRAGDAKPARPRRIPGGDHACPECDDRFTTSQGVAVHRARKHGYRAAAAR